jgi:hypothetical protein
VAPSIQSPHRPLSKRTPDLTGDAGDAHVRSTGTTTRRDLVARVEKWHPAAYTKLVSSATKKILDDVQPMRPVRLRLSVQMEGAEGSFLGE